MTQKTEPQFHLGQHLIARLDYSVKVFRALADTYQNEDGTYRNEEHFNKLLRNADSLETIVNESRDELQDLNDAESLSRVVVRWQETADEFDVSDDAVAHLSTYVGDYYDDIAIHMFNVALADKQ